MVDVEDVNKEDKPSISIVVKNKSNIDITNIKEMDGVDEPSTNTIVED